MPTPTRIRVPALIALVLLPAFFAGCASDDHEADRGGSARRHHEPPPPPLAGSESYFDGKITAEITVGAFAGPHGGPRASDSQGESGGGGGRRHRHGGGGYGGEGGGFGGEGEGGGGERSAGMHPMMGGGLGPRQMIHLKLTNHGSEPMVLNIDDFVSPFGNFAVQPETLTIAPGQTVEVEPMSSQLAGALNEADATLVLRLAGRSEKKVIVLRTVAPAPAAPAPAAGK